MATTIATIVPIQTVVIPTGTHNIRLMSNLAWSNPSQQVSVPVGSHNIKLLAGLNIIIDPLQTVLVPSASPQEIIQYGLNAIEAYFVYDDSEGTFEDYTTEAGESTIDDVFDMATDPAGTNDAVYVGNDNQFDMISVDITTQSGTNQSGHGVWEYWDGDSWEAVTVQFNTWWQRADTGPGIVLFTEPGDWAETTINGFTGYFLRWRFTSASNPTARRRMATVQVRQSQTPAAIGGIYPAGIATFTHFTKWTQATVAWATKISSEIEAYQKDYASAAGNFNTLASRLAVLRTSLGTWRPDTLTHGIFSPSTNQHHTQYHTTTHLDGNSDVIVSATADHGGWLTTKFYAKLATMASNSTRNYVSNGLTGSALDGTSPATQPWLNYINHDFSVLYGESFSNRDNTSGAPIVRVMAISDRLNMLHQAYNTTGTSNLAHRHRTQLPGIDWYWYWLGHANRKIIGMWNNDGSQAFISYSPAGTKAA